MNFQDYQNKTKETAIYPGKGETLGVCYTAIGMANEAGEVCGKIKKMLRDDNGVLLLDRQEAILDEIGDVLWYISQLCTECGISLESAAYRNISKLRDRASRNVIGGDGDTR